MATPKHVVALLILAFLSVSIGVEARDVKERQSFSKFTNANDNDDKENARVIPTKEESLTTAETLKKQENQEEMVKNTPATATSTSTSNRLSETTMPDDSFYSYLNGNFENSNNYYNDRSYDRRSNNYYNKDAYVADQREQARDAYMPEEQNFGGNTRLQDSSYTTTTTTTTTGSHATNDRNNYYTSGNRHNTAQQEGMSDTRFMENGKYFYDLDNEEKYYQNRYQRSKPGYSTQGYYVNTNRNHNNNVNLYEQQFNNVDDNFMGGYQDQKESLDLSWNDLAPLAPFLNG